MVVVHRPLPPPCPELRRACYHPQVTWTFNHSSSTSGSRDLDDLRERLRRTRWPDEIEDAGWDYGSNLGYVRELCAYWAERFDWRAQEERINRFPQFRTEIEGLGIHFVHVRGTGPAPRPLLITHGWPSTFVELLPIIPLLADPGSHGGDPADAFDVVVPSMPGYGFSDRPARRGMSPVRVAGLWHALMTGALGYDRFFAQGGDWGAQITAALGLGYPDRVRGIHLTMAAGTAPVPPRSELSAAEREFLRHRDWWQRAEGAYGHQHGTKPQTLAYGLNDSPAGLAAWIIEKWRTWSDCGGDLESRFSKDELLTHLTIYWATRTIGSSIRLYYESGREPLRLTPEAGVTVPTAFASFPVEISYPPREWLERTFNLIRYTRMPRGGHFAATEEPELLARDVREAFRGLQ